MTTLAVLGDVHGKLDRLEQSLALIEAKPIDLALLSGDVGRDPPWFEPSRRRQRHKHDTSVREVVALVVDRLRCPVAFVPGNHDLHDPPSDVDAVNLDGRVESMAGLTLAGTGGAGPRLFGFAYEWSEEALEERMRSAFDPAPEGLDVWLCHTPPADTRLDRVREGLHVGSRTVDRWLSRLRPRLFVCGHIHEAWGVDRHRETVVLNAGALADPVAQTLIWTVDWEAGPVAVRAHRLRDGADIAEVLEAPAPAGDPPLQR